MAPQMAERASRDTADVFLLFSFSFFAVPAVAIENCHILPGPGVRAVFGDSPPDRVISDERKKAKSDKTPTR